MKRHKVLAIGLDGLDFTLAEKLMAEGQMPALANLRKRAARFPLDQGPAALRAGLPWENVASGLSPEAGRRWGPFEFDPASYTAYQEGTHFAPWWAETDLQVVVFDSPFVDLCRSPNTQGIMAWGAHSPGTITTARPETLLGEFEQRFGHYPASEWLYASPWPSAARTQLMGEALSEALKLRGRAAQWLAAERFPEWDFFFAVPSEVHAGVEGLWHGLDANHPLHTHPSAEAAGRGLVQIHRALDEMVGRLVETAGDAAIIAFNMGGMGPNHCDVQSIVLLPELLYRHAFGHALLNLPPAWTSAPNRLPILDENDSWERAKTSWVPGPRASTLRTIARRLPKPVKALLKGGRSGFDDHRPDHRQIRREPFYMTSYSYRRHWPRMPAFAVPSFLDGRIRINLRGRERLGIVELSQYEETCRTLETLLGECRDPRTGEPVVSKIVRAQTANPLTLASSESDMLIVWRDVAAAFEHPRLGLIGPVPLRRTGGHTPHGIAYLMAPGIEPGERSLRSSFDVVPTIVELLGAEPTRHVVGTSLLSDAV